jgi:hypothetical protein
MELLLSQIVPEDVAALRWIFDEVLKFMKLPSLDEAGIETIRTWSQTHTHDETRALTH